MHAVIPGAARAVHPVLVNLLRGISGLAGALLLVAMLSQGALAHGYKAGSIEIGHPWSRVVPEGAKVAAGYLTLTNTGSEADRLVAVTAEPAGKAEIHEMSVNGEGVMTMRALPEGVEIPAGATVELKPGSYHVMLTGLTRWAKEGETFKGTLTFEKAGTVEIEFKVQAAGKADTQPAMDHSSHGG